MPKKQNRALKRKVARGQSVVLAGARKGSQAYNLMKEIQGGGLASQYERNGRPLKLHYAEHTNDAMNFAWKIAYANGLGQTPKKHYTLGTFTDSHVWLQKGDDIIDPTPPDEHYKPCKKHYQAWEGKDRLMCFMDWKNKWETCVKEEVEPPVTEYLMKIGPEKYKLMREVSTDEEWYKSCGKKYLRQLANEPEVRKCYYNVLAIKDKHPDYQVMFGSLGYGVAPGIIFWEFG